MLSSLYFEVNCLVMHVPHACVHQWSNVTDLNLAVIIIIPLHGLFGIPPTDQ